MGLFGSSRDKETIERLTQQLNQQKAEYERKISEKDSEMSELKAKYSKREDSILAVKEIELQKLKEKIKALEGKISNRTEPENKADDASRIGLREEYEKKIEELQREVDDLRRQLKESAQGEFDTSKFVLPAGKYKGGIDIPIGIYNIKIVSGNGIFEKNKPEDLYFRMCYDDKKRNEYDWADEYRNIEVSEKTIIKISESAKIEFSISRKYDFSAEYQEEKKREEERIAEIKRECESKKYDIEHEIKILEKELKKLNDECIRKYYQFSSYDSLTSQDCKNELAILKQKEMDLRREEGDIVKQKGVTMSARDKRIVRQMLRTFNAECDNIMMNISLKSIDKVRSQIQKSFDTINTIYTNGNWLDHSLLELKLQQATLIYTYELKYQQEKDIQRAIKEQMLEEAKAQREIEEQKKKIEKDLQQHLGEVNRIMKYMQKTQIDAEKQLYMDKIKELEEKIKVLQSDKETVLEREANAKAGFVYIISNIGSFGENIYKIGMTRRLEPMDRIHELSSASVPFEFDVHAMIFSSDAPELETTLHRHFANNAVNKVNPRKEFYNVDIDEIERVVKENYNDTVQFTKIPIAAEYRQSLNLMDNAEQKPPVLQGILDIGMEIEEDE